MSTRATTPATLYGGQAVIEGVMMRGVEHFAVACRKQAGEIALTCEPVPKVFRPAWQKLPLLRGAFSLVDAMALGTRAMFWAAKVAESDIASPAEESEIRHSGEAVGLALGTAVTARQPETRTSGRVSDVAIGSAMVTGLLLALALIIVVPNLALQAIKHTGVHEWWKLGPMDAAIRFTIFFGYIIAIGRMKHVHRVFQYHGAEHKAINALEAQGKDNLSLAGAQEASRLHPRCGTSFVVIVMVLSTLALMPFYGLPPIARIPLHLLLTLPVAGVSFELLRLAGKYRDNPVAAALSRPGMWTQLLTTREPDASQLEVAIASLRAVMNADIGAPVVSHAEQIMREEVAVA